MNIGVRSFSGGMASCRLIMVDTAIYSHSNFFLYISNDKMMQDRASIMGIYSFHYAHSLEETFSNVQRTSPM